MLVIQKDGNSFMKYSKFFFDRSSGQGFLRGIPDYLSNPSITAERIAKHGNTLDKHTRSKLPKPYTAD
jgi:hypothetical protein